MGVQLQDKLKAMEESHQKTIRYRRKKQQELHAETEDLEVTYDDKIKVKGDEYASHVRLLEQSHQDRYMNEIEKYNALEKTIKVEERANEEKSLAKQDEHGE